jgi:hypothetical protein
MKRENAISIIPLREANALLKRLEKLRGRIGDIPKEYLSGEPLLAKPPDSFDANRFFEVFDKVGVKPGYTLDYAFYHGGIGGQPVLYTREIGAEPILDAGLLRDAVAEGGPRAESMRHVEFERSPSGFFQFDVFCVAVGQFYLFWHALYNDLSFVVNRGELRQILAMIRGSESAAPIPPAERIRVGPRVKMDDEGGAQVTTVTFSSWSGLSYRHSQLRWPNVVEKVHERLIARYVSPICF